MYKSFRAIRKEKNSLGRICPLNVHVRFVSCFLSFLPYLLARGFPVVSRPSDLSPSILPPSTTFEALNLARVALLAIVGMIIGLLHPPSSLTLAIVVVVVLLVATFARGG